MATPCCKSAAMAAAKSIAIHSKCLLPKVKASRTLSPLILRSIPSSLGCVQSLMPLHSAIASARLRSNIGVDSSCWSSLSQDFAVPR